MRTLPGIAFVDFLANLLVVFVVFFALAFAMINPRATEQRIETLGVYAVVLHWQPGLPDDIDLYLQDPQGQINYFANQNAGYMHLERDDLGLSGELFNGRIQPNNDERIVIRGAEVGEYTANVHMYNNISGLPVKVRVSLFRLRGPDAPVTKKTLTMRFKGDEQTAFRFSLDERQRVVDINDLQKKFIDEAQRQAREQLSNNSNTNAGYPPHNPDIPDPDPTSP